MCGIRIKDLRKERNITQSDLAKILNVTQDSISLWEKNKRVPDTQYIIQLANYFEVSTDYLLGRSDDFGNVTVTTASPSAVLTPDELELLELYKKLPRTRQKTVLDTIRFMSESPETAENPRKEKFYGTK